MSKWQQSKGMLAILLWAVIYLVDLALVVGFNWVYVYTIPEPQPGQYPPDFNQWLDGEQLDAYGSLSDGFHVLYRTDAGERRLVWIQVNQVLNRFDVVESSDQQVGLEERVDMEVRLLRTVDGDIIDPHIGVESQRTGIGYFVSYDQSSVMGSYMAIALVILLVEYFLYWQFSRMFR